MSANFWLNISKPIFALAPMEDVTDTVFREVVMAASDGQHLNVLFSEFTSTDGMCHPKGRKRVEQRLYINKSELELIRQRGIKIVAQIWGSKPEMFTRTAQIITNEFEFDGIDINMGCPVKKVFRQGSCASLIAYPDLAQEIVLATKAGTHLPVSVKTRTGIKQDETERWMAQLIEVKPAAITLHCRTRNDMTAVPARWDEVAKAVAVRNAMNPEIPILGNGDVMSLEAAAQRMAETGADGVMIGRGIFGNPWLFNNPQPTHTPQEKVNLLWFHTQLFEKTWGRGKNFNILKRFFKIYTSGFTDAAQIRAQLMDTHTADDVKQVLMRWNYVVAD